MLKRLSDVLPRPDPWKSCIERSELPEELERAVVKEMHRIVGRAETERDIAKELKLFLEREVGGRWCGIVGTAFGTSTVDLGNVDMRSIYRTLSFSPTWSRCQDRVKKTEGGGRAQVTGTAGPALRRATTPPGLQHTPGQQQQHPNRGQMTTRQPCSPPVSQRERKHIYRQGARFQ
ncbi:hypothetical protein SprV_0200591600 [Sparganum proliferum]